MHAESAVNTQAPALPARPPPTTTASSYPTPAPPIQAPPTPARPQPQQVSSTSGSQSTAVGPIPTSTPQSGHPLLREGRLLVYPRGKPRCEKCGNTGYKGGDTTRPCNRCWRKYGREYSGALKQAYEGGTSLSSVLQDTSLQRPLPASFQYLYPAPGGPQSAGYMPQNPYQYGAYPASHQAPYAPYAPAPANLPHLQYGPPTAMQAASEPERFPEDQHNSAPPVYQQASATEKPLPEQQYYQPPAPNLPPRPYPSPAPPAAWGHTPAPLGPTYNWYGYMPPSGAITVQPGDPRIGGVLCPRCYGSGESRSLVSLFLGDEECDYCGGTGRVGH